MKDSLLRLKGGKLQPVLQYALAMPNQASSLALQVQQLDHLLAETEAYNSRTAVKAGLPQISGTLAGIRHG